MTAESEKKARKDQPALAMSLTSIRLIGAHNRTFPIFSPAGITQCIRDAELDLSDALYIALSDLAIEQGTRKIVLLLSGSSLAGSWRALQTVGAALSRGIAVVTILLASGGAGEFGQEFRKMGGLLTTVETPLELDSAIGNAFRGSGTCRCIVDCSGAATTLLWEVAKGTIIGESLSKILPMQGS